MRKRKSDAIAEVSDAADQLLVACERYLGRDIPRKTERPFARAVHDALADVEVLPPDLAAQIARLN